MLIKKLQLHWLDQVSRMKNNVQASNILESEPGRGNRRKGDHLSNGSTKYWHRCQILKIAQCKEY